MTGAPDTGALALIAGFLGGLGLFLLGMHLMAEGLRTAGGRTLKSILGNWTRTRIRALSVGIGVTALVQSSSAVTLSIIGFANAGLLTVSQSVWVVFGSSMGTTATGWLVSLLGLEFSIQALALPAVGIGGLVYILARGARARHLGLALAGFGLLFLGIDVLRETFVGVSEAMDLGHIARPGLAGILLMMATGLGLTMLMQSSSAAIAMALTAAMSGAISLEAAAAAMIGAHLGTSVKAVIVVIGATANAKRVAAALVIFKLISTVIALALLPVLSATLLSTEDGVLAAPPVVLLALYHTLFNLLGILLMLPLASPLIRYLQGRFRGTDLDEARPRYLDRSSAGVPELALQALIMETERVGDLSHRMARKALGEVPPDERKMQLRHSIVEDLAGAIGEFATQTGHTTMTDATAEGIAGTVRVARYYQDIADQAGEIAGLRREAGNDATPAISTRRRAWQGRVIHALDRSRVETEDDVGEQEMNQAMTEVEEAYQDLKAALLREGTFGSLSMAEMDRQLRIISLARRMAGQAAKARAHLQAVRVLSDGGASGSRRNNARGDRAWTRTL
ncbi:Na/Pi cotransporter family protein [Thioalkalivibrio halophilus]|uniref:Na/Pi-cotransporter II-like protein n=1 Tax=Thioalkalivibrio halophilus TaxID=252474 RepID=A0A1V3A019_9GAMM|nr:Na/Pi symporter [Thioalkalivibrio halophilus]OOC10681.1 Na/Pi-cotransporter II-like protein [Thioalkalivibrio halophilus]